MVHSAKSPSSPVEYGVYTHSIHTLTTIYMHVQCTYTHACVRTTNYVCVCRYYMYVDTYVCGHCMYMCMYT